MFQGVYTALITPFNNGSIDFESLANLIEDQLNNGIQGFVVCGTTAESPTLLEEEKLKILDFVVEKTNKRVPIVFGSGSNSTQGTIELSHKACKRSIDGLLVVVPYYNKPPQEGLLAHFTAVADAVEKPIILYNVPGRTVTSLEPNTIVELAKHPNIHGIKEADCDMNNFSKYKSLVPDDFSLLSGDDESSVRFCFLGGHGVISVCSHVGPHKMVEWITKAREKDESFREEFRQNTIWINKLYMRSNPIPTKAILKHKGIIASNEMRLPLTAMPQEEMPELLEAFRNFKGIL